MSLPAVLLALAGPALAQESEFTPDGANCADPFPISGTAGVRNATAAIQANANTCSASNFANRQLNSLDEDNYSELGGSDGLFGIATDINVTYGAARMLVHHPKVVSTGGLEPTEGASTCEGKWRVETKGLDLQAANTGFVFKKGPVGLFYATSFTWAAPAYGDQFTRILMTSFVAPAYVFSASTLAGPLDLITSGPLESTNEFSAIRLEWMGGATLELDKVHASAAYLSSGGAYLQASEEVLGSYLFASLKGGEADADVSLGDTSVIQLGFDRFDPDEVFGAADGLGLASLAYQQLPTLLSGSREGAPTLYEQLRVGRVHQQNVGGTFDVNARYRIAPAPSISELTVGVHTVDFHAPRTGREDEGVMALLQGGTTNTPAAWAQGNGPEQLWTARAAIGGQFSDADLSSSIYLNDPDQLQLYPFARNAVSYQSWGASAAL
jgi:hypothetical protein